MYKFSLLEAGKVFGLLPETKRIESVVTVVERAVFTSDY
jgi:hypothetical protein|tara:strand:- start:466 stop:582 length:117 start_codon:yes stop_codon:yes gene_type:complete